MWLGSYNLIVSVALTVVLIVGGENVIMKSRLMASGMITGTIGTTANKRDTINCQQLVLATVNLHQQIIETAIMYLVVVLMNTMTSFLYMCIASAPIHIHATSVKLWIRTETVTQPPYTLVWAIPHTNTISMQKREMQSWIWNLDTSRLRRLLQECIVCPHINVWAMVGPQCTHLDTNNVMTAAERPKRERDVPTVEMMSRANLTAAGCSSPPPNLVRMSYKLTNQIWLQTWNSNVHVTALFTRARNLLAKCNNLSYS